LPHCAINFGGTIWSKV